MIDLITDVLDRRGLIPASRFEACNIYIGKNLVFHVYDKGGAFIVAKVRDSTDAEAEFAALQLAHETMPEVVPRPLALDRVRDTYLMLIEGVGHAAHLEDPETFARMAGAFLAAISKRAEPTGDPT